MTKQSIIEAQEYLRVRTHYGCKRILDIYRLSGRSSIGEIIELLRENQRQKEKELRNMIMFDKTHPKVDRLVAAMFRISMAIKSLEEGKEVVLLERTQSGAEKSRQFHQRDSGGHRGAGIGQNQNHDGKNRVSGDQSKRAA